MDAPKTQVFFPQSFGELFSTWALFPDAVIFAGGTGIIGRQGKNIISLPKTIISLENFDDLKNITRTESYLEAGAMVKLSRLVKLGKLVPKILVNTLENIGGAQIRNVATIGGNICNTYRLFDLHAPLIALDAQYELRSSNNTRWVSASRFHSENCLNSEKQELLSRIRLPLHEWEYSFFKKYYSETHFNCDILIFLAKVQKNTLTEVKVVYKSDTIIRNKNSEEDLFGHKLPLNRKIAHDFIENWRKFLEERHELSEFAKNALLHGIGENINNLSD